MFVWHREVASCGRFVVWQRVEDRLAVIGPVIESGSAVSKDVDHLGRTFTKHCCVCDAVAGFTPVEESSSATGRAHDRDGG